MTRKTRVADLPVFDITEHLDSDEAVAAYLTAVIDEDDPSELAHALGVVARARGMTQVAKDAGLAREALYKALRPGAQPRFDTVQRVCSALGVKLTVTATHRLLRRPDTPVRNDGTRPEPRRQEGGTPAAGVARVGLF